ncbi:MAG: TM0106 family RecB-like putative nuclease [Solirubrobacterales bacterium]
MAAKVTRDVLESYLDCKTKAHLRLAGQQGSVSDYENLLVVKRQEVRQTAIDKILAKQHEGEVVRDISLTADALRAGPSIVLDTNLEDGLLSVRFDGLKRVDGPSKLGDFHYVPMLFHGGRKVNKEQRLLLELFGLLLSQVQGRLPASGVVWHGRACRASKLRLNPDVRRTERLLREVKEMIGVESPPRLILNDHCRICEFRRMCQATAVEKDDLSLLRGLPPKDIAGLNRRGIFTVTQYSYTFRPGRLKRAVERKSPKYDHSLQALAVRDNTVYVAQRPELPDDRARLYLDVEGLPDADSYYLIGLTVEEGGTQRRLCFWADHGAEEAVIWRSFLEVAGSIEDFVLFHYGSYESHFLKRMEARHGGDPRLIAKLKSRSVNVLSLIYGRVYFPAYSNDLKSVAGCLGCCWAAADASGLQSIVWRHGWEAARDEAVKQRLLAYNEEDRSALSTVVELLRFVSSESQPGYIGTGPRVAAVADIEVPRRHKFCDPEYVLPELNRITKCAYFDYQRDKVLFRTSPGPPHQNSQGFELFLMIIPSADISCTIVVIS